MDSKTGRPDHIGDYLSRLHNAHWCGWSNPKEPIYANLILHPIIWDTSYKGSIHAEGLIANPHSKPTEQECIDGLAQMQTDFDNAKTKKAEDKASGNAKLKALGLTDDEIKVLTKG